MVGTSNSTTTTTATIGTLDYLSKTSDFPFNGKKVLSPFRAATFKEKQGPQAVAPRPLVSHKLDPTTSPPHSLTRFLFSSSSSPSSHFALSSRALSTVSLIQLSFLPFPHSPPHLITMGCTQSSPVDQEAKARAYPLLALCHPLVNGETKPDD